MVPGRRPIVARMPGAPQDLEPPAQPEAIRGAKEWLNQRMRTGAYSANLDQASLTAVFDLEPARRVPSFDKCYREVIRLLETLPGAWSSNSRDSEVSSIGRLSNLGPFPPVGRSLGNKSRMVR